MNTAERSFLAKVWFAVAGFVCWQSFSFFYGCTVPGVSLTFPIFGDLSFTDRAVLGIPALFAGYSLAYVLGVVVMRNSSNVPFPEAPDGEFTRAFLKTAFYFIMLVPVIAMVFLLFGALHRVKVRPTDGTHPAGVPAELSGWQIYKHYPGSWWARGINPKDEAHLTLHPGVEPPIFAGLALLSVLSLAGLPWIVERSARGAVAGQRRD